MCKIITVYISLQPFRYLLTVQICIHSIRSLITPDQRLCWSIMIQALKSEEKKFVWRSSLSHYPGDSARFMKGLHRIEIGRWR